MRARLPALPQTRLLADFEAAELNALQLLDLFILPDGFIPGEPSRSRVRMWRDTLVVGDCAGVCQTAVLGYRHRTDFWLGGKPFGQGRQRLILRKSMLADFCVIEGGLNFLQVRYKLCRRSQIVAVDLGH